MSCFWFQAAIRGFEETEGTPEKFNLNYSQVVGAQGKYFPYNFKAKLNATNRVKTHDEMKKFSLFLARSKNIQIIKIEIPM